MTFRILLADDHEVVRRGLCAILQKKGELEVCGEASDGREAIELAKHLKPDAVIIDIGMPNVNGLDATSFGFRERPSWGRRSPRC